MTRHFDVAIVGGGPAGSTVASMLKTYQPSLSVGIFERETFPREHVGESLLPGVGLILQEIGVWDQVEAANFPIKVGATYKWGTTDDLWNFNLLDTREVPDDTPRPGKYEGWRVRSTWQVDRASFDKILLDHSKVLGCEIFEGVGVIKCRAEQDSIAGLELSDGSEVTARYYVDCSGHSGALRRCLSIDVEEPPSLKNIAIWKYWDDADWAVSIGTGGTRVQITSVGFGWLWFIPITPSRTSVGLVCPVDYFKQCGKSTEQIYADALLLDARISTLMRNATPVGKVSATKDWSFVAKRLAGPNWFLAGESAGFADPILSSGVTISMVAAKECAYSILALDRGTLNHQWICDNYARRQQQRISQHIKFANFWYSANTHFTDLMQYTSEIAREVGLKMDAKTAWQWLGSGGFISLETEGAGFAGHTFEQLKSIEGMMFSEESEWLITKYNIFDLNLGGSTLDKYPIYQRGAIKQVDLHRRGDRELPEIGSLQSVIEILRKGNSILHIIQEIRAIAVKRGPIIAMHVFEGLESLVSDGWVSGSFSPQLPLLKSSDIPRTLTVDWNNDETDPRVKLAESLYVAKVSDA